MEPFTIELDIEKETDNTHRYKEVTGKGNPPKVRTLYIQKWVLGDPAPQRIRVTIEEA